MCNNSPAQHDSEVCIPLFPKQGTGWGDGDNFQGNSKLFLGVLSGPEEIRFPEMKPQWVHASDNGSIVNAYLWEC